MSLMSVRVAWVWRGPGTRNYRRNSVKPCETERRASAEVPRVSLFVCLFCPHMSKNLLVLFPLFCIPPAIL